MGKIENRQELSEILSRLDRSNGLSHTKAIGCALSYADMRAIQIEEAMSARELRARKSIAAAKWINAASTGRGCGNYQPLARMLREEATGIMANKPNGSPEEKMGMDLLFLSDAIKPVNVIDMFPPRMMRIRRRS